MGLKPRVKSKEPSTKAPRPSALRDLVETQLRELRFSKKGVSDEIVKGLAPTIGIGTAKSTKNAQVGSSKLGGRPDLAPATQWPRSKYGDSPLAFVAQINFSEISQHPDLPTAGLLSIFVTADEDEDEAEIASKVLFSKETAGLASRELPDDLSHDANFVERPLVFSESFQILDEDGDKARFQSSDENKIEKLFGKLGCFRMAQMLGRPNLYNEDLDEQFREHKYLLLMQLYGEEVWCSNRPSPRKPGFKSLYRGSFNVVLRRGDAEAGNYSSAFVLYDGAT